MKRLVVLPLLLAVACGRPPAPPPADAAASRQWNPSQLDQRWSATTSEHYWFTSQGSQIVPYAYFLALEVKDSQERFAASAHLDRLRFLTVSGPSKLNPDALPIGFVKNHATVDGDEVLGITCAACHTGKWKIAGVDVLIDGAPSKADLQQFFDELIDATTQTLEQTDKFNRFAAKIPGDPAHVRSTLTAWRDRLLARRNRNPMPAGNAPGFGRDDAFNKLVNEIAGGDLGIPENAGVADAPASIPQVWDAPQHDRVQWNGKIPNAGFGPAIRNIGEVLGVYGTIDITPRTGRWPEYPTTSAETANLNAIEEDLWSLSSPKWPGTLVPIDLSRAAAGRPLFDTHCGGCHQPIDRTSVSRRVKAVLTDVGSDPALNQAAARTVRTGRLAGMPKLLNPTDLFKPRDSAIDVMVNAVFGTYRAHRADFPKMHLLALDETRRTGSLPPIARLFGALEGDVQQLAADYQAASAAVVDTLRKTTGPLKNEYKARPLNGIWATAPYLHNGSVPSLTELLKQDSERVKEFYVGSWVLDTVNVGVTSVPAEEGVKLFLYDTSLKGNSNAGHNFGTELTAEQKKQLIEYIKTL